MNIQKQKAPGKTYFIHAPMKKERGPLNWKVEPMDYVNECIPWERNDSFRAEMILRFIRHFVTRSQK